jgi:hypothetical protein
VEKYRVLLKHVSTALPGVGGNPDICAEDAMARATGRYRRPPPRQDRRQQQQRRRPPQRRPPRGTPAPSVTSDTASHASSRGPGSISSSSRASNSGRQHPSAGAPTQRAYKRQRSAQ